MKLLMCNKCLDVFSLSLNKEKFCSCGNAKGQYINDLNAEYSGNVTLIGFHNSSLRESLVNIGSDFTAFTIKKDCKTFKEKKD